MNILKTIFSSKLNIKFIGFTFLVIVFTVTIISSIIISSMSNAIENKAFDVAKVSIRSIGDFSKLALLERNQENRINLNEIIKDIKNTNIDGFLDISIYEHTKKDEKRVYKYLTGFKGFVDNSYLNDFDLIEKLEKNKEDKILILDGKFLQEEKQIETYRFIKPIYFNYLNEKLLLGIVVLNYDKESIYGVVSQTVNSSIFFTILIVILISIIVFFMGTKFTKPILKLTDAAKDITKGNLDVKLDVKTDDEIGKLSQSFNSMIRGLKERNKMQKFMSTSTFDMIKDTNSENISLGGRKTELTILFTDIRGFTAMSETKSPDVVIEIINFYLNLQSDIIKKYGGDIDKYVGDEIMASFSSDDGLNKAIDCALEIQEEILKYNNSRKDENKTLCEVGIGINKGEVIVGNVGSKDRMDFTSMGANVNLAERLCSHAKPKEIIVGQKLDLEFKKQYYYEEKNSLEFKGFKKSFDITYIKGKMNV